MQLHDALCDGKPQSVSVRGMGGISLIKFLEDMRYSFRGDFWPLIGKSNRISAINLFHPYLNPAMCGRKFNGIAQQIDPYLAQHFLVAGQKIFLTVKAEPDIFSRQLFIEKGNRQPYLFAEIETAFIR